MNVDYELQRVLHSAYVNTDLACRFVLEELCRIAASMNGRDSHVT